MNENLTPPVCQTCQREKEWTDCWKCGGEGGTDGEELMLEDPLWYYPHDFRLCDICNGDGGYYVCQVCHPNTNDES